MYRDILFYEGRVPLQVYMHAWWICERLLCVGPQFLTTCMHACMWSQLGPQKRWPGIPPHLSSAAAARSVAKTKSLASAAESGHLVLSWLMHASYIPSLSDNTSRTRQAMHLHALYACARLLYIRHCKKSGRHRCIHMHVDVMTPWHDTIHIFQI